MRGFLVIGVVVSWALSGCDSADVSYYEPPPPDESPPVRATIDRDAELVDRNPGYAIGVFVEYRQGGQWRIDVGCDTATSMFSCSWLVVAEPLEGTLTDVVTHDLESSDDFELLPTSVGIHSTTTDDMDGVGFGSEPGTAIALFVALDGYAESRFVYWVGDGAVHAGAPEVPFELEPDLP
ncbi:MAG TPA: hypothetical protein VFU02_16915 [Polyangiaceae bacterium]|nr:hypothetical protein [Polyangiaceae bacterium]